MCLLLSSDAALLAHSELGPARDGHSTAGLPGSRACCDLSFMVSCLLRGMAVGVMCSAVVVSGGKNR